MPTRSEHSARSRPWLTALLAACLGLLSAGSPIEAAESPSVHQWRVAGTKPADYDARLVEHGGPDGSHCARLASDAEEPEGFVALLRRLETDRFKGQRVRLEAQVRAQDVEGWAGLIMRIDDTVVGRSVAFDNMVGRPIQGTSGWTTYSIVLDVPVGDHRTTGGILLAGRGIVWVDSFSLEEVPANTPVTDLFVRSSQAQQGESETP